MRSIIIGLGVLGALVAGGMRAEARPLPAAPSAVQQVDWGYCGPRCQEQRHEARQREIERQRLAEHRRWEHQRWQESHRQPVPPAYGYHRY